MAFGIEEGVQENFMAQLQELSDEELEMLLDEVELDLPDGHLVEFVDACKQETTKFEEKRQRLNRALLAAYENEMPELQQKEAWQAKITLPTIFTTCFQAKSLVRKAVAEKTEYFEWDAYDKDDLPSVQKARFWKDALNYWGRRSKFHTLFPDMTEMSFVQGVSPAMKCVMRRNPSGPDTLKLLKVNQENIFRDPDAKPREPQSGLYCIHQDWVDYHELVKGQEEGIYMNVGPHIWGNESEYNTQSTRRREDQQQKRRNHLAERNRFRKSVLVSEFWGTVLDQNGEIAMSNVMYTVANKTVIQRPVRVEFPTIKWPIHQFSAIPHFERFNGISLVEGVFKLWKLRNNLLCMSTDKLSFSLLDMFEVDPSILQNAADVEIYPGALKFRKPNKQGSAYTKIELSARLEEMEPLWNISASEIQNGSFITDLIRGTFGAGNKDTTATEQKIKYEQGLGVFENIGRDVEEGGVDGLRMMQEFLTVAWDPNDHQTFAPFLNKHPEVADMLMRTSPDERIEALNVESDVSMRGVSLLLEKSDRLQRIKELMAITESPRFGFYVKDDKLIEAAVDSLNMEDALKSDDELEIELQQQQQQQAAMMGQPPQGGAQGLMDQPQPQMM